MKNSIDSGNTAPQPRSGIAHLNPDHLSKGNLATLRAGMDACAALWLACDDKSLWEDLKHHPLFGCVFATHALVDVLNAMGHRDARIRPVGFQLQRNGELPRALTIGASSTPHEEGAVNAHFVVTKGAVLFDPSHAQVRRPWNNAPTFAAFKIRNSFKVKVSGERNVFEGISETVWGPPIAGAYNEYEVRFYELPREGRRRIRGWETSPDMRPERRAPIVRRAIEILKARA